jgi:hypothetical protein
MRKQIPVAKVGDVCILVEPTGSQTAPLRQLQQSLQTRYGGRLHQRPHFTCQRFSPRDDNHLASIIRRLQARLDLLPPLPVTARELVLAQHPFWEFSVLRWDLHLTDLLHGFAEIVNDVLAEAGLSGHYPSGKAWNPHVTALEKIYQNGHRPGAQSPSRRFLFSGQQVVLSRIQPGKQFEIVGNIPLDARQAGPGRSKYLRGFGQPPGS